MKFNFKKTNLFMSILFLFGCSNNNHVSWTDDGKLMYKGETYSYLYDSMHIFPKGELIEIGYSFGISPVINKFYVNSLDKECNIIYDRSWHKLLKNGFLLPNDLEEKISYLGIELSFKSFDEIEKIDIAYYELIDNVSFDTLFEKIDDDLIDITPDTERHNLYVIYHGYEHMYMGYHLLYINNELFLEKCDIFKQIVTDIYKVNELYENNFLTAINIKKNNK